MRMSLKTLLASLVLGASACVSAAATKADAGLPPDQVWIHDPVIAKDGDWSYLFSTGPGIKMFRSRDLQHWFQLKPVFDPPPPWSKAVAPGFDGAMWAPDISYFNGQYYLYYSVSAMGKNTSAIGVATTPTLDQSSPDYHWTDHGVVVQSVPNRDLWNAIDPNLIVDADGTPWMSFGSFWDGIKLVKLRPDRLRVAEPEAWYTLARRERPQFMPDADPGPAAEEAPYIIHHGDHYYLFVSWDFCCRGADSTYRIMIGRSDKLEGPYVDKDGKPMLEGGGSQLLAGTKRWPGPGHNSVYTFDGTEYLVFHAYDPTDDGKSKLHMVPMRWDADGWPVQPSDALAR